MSALSPKSLINGCNVRPFKNNVANTKPVTEIAMKLRASSGRLVCSVAANAKANDTAPRKPPHQMTTLKLALTRAPTRNQDIRGSKPKTTTARAKSVALNTSAT